MDLTDKKILAILDENSRIPSSMIAKKIKTSRQIVDYRIKQLTDKGIILNFTTLIDPTKFFDNIWHVYVKLQNLTPESEKRILEHLNKKKEVWWVAKCHGEWDLVFSVLGDDLFMFDRLISEFRTKFHKFINEETITTLVSAYRFSRGYFLDKRTKREVYVSKREKQKINDKDLKILKLLSSNSRMPSTKIADKTNLTARQVLYRIKELITKKLIRGFGIHMDNKKTDYDYYKVCFYTQGFTETSEEAVIRWCEENPNAIYYVKKISPWTFEMEFETKDYKELNNILIEIRNKFGSIIKRTEITSIIQELKGELNIFN